jgi:putative transcriptional regulator
MIASLAGRLLVATPLLEDANFARTVVFICSHNEDGAFGLVLNRPLGEPVAQHLPDWGRRAVAPAVFFAGGPVQRHIVMGLGRDLAIVDAGWWTRVTPEIGLIDLRYAPNDALRTTESMIESARLFVGYAGWGGGQLEAEIAQEAWFVVDSRPGDVFSAHPERMWADVLRRQRGRKANLALFANYPRDLRVN